MSCDPEGGEARGSEQDPTPGIREVLDGGPEAPSSRNPQAETLGNCPDFCSNLGDSDAQIEGNPGTGEDALLLQERVSGRPALPGRALRFGKQSPKPRPHPARTPQSHRLQRTLDQHAKWHNPFIRSIYNKLTNAT